ncbi:MAG TPA: hypothetical protein VN132_12410, partial [Bdellovibrio sp.]|nr:hypothetical protein [Bdellovibrio sp.]
MKFFVKTFLKIVLALSLGVQTSRAEAPLCSDIFSTQRSITDNYDQSRQSSWFIIKKTQAIQHLKVFYEYQKFFAENENNPVLNDSQTKYLFKKILTEFITDKSRLSKEDLDFIFSTPERRKFFEGVLYYQAVIEIPFRTLQQLIQYTGTRGQGFDLWNAPTVQGKVKHLFQSFYNGPLKYMLLVPIGVDLPGGLSPTAKIFKKLWKDGSYDPTPEEWQTLKAYKSEKIFNERKDFMNEHRQWVRVRRLTDYALNAILAISIIEAFNLYLEVDQQDATVDAAEFLNNPRYALAQDEVRVYNETVPFPHMAIEIDGLVYSYGQTHMTVRGAREYIFEEKMHDQALAGKKAQEQTFLQKAISFSGLDKMERVIQSVRIHLSMEEKGKLKRYLEMQTGKR